MINEIGEGRESFARSGRQTLQDSERGAVGWWDRWEDGRSRRDRADIVDIGFEFLSVLREKRVHRFHPLLFATECRHITQTLKGFRNKSQSTASLWLRVILQLVRFCFCNKKSKTHL